MSAIKISHNGDRGYIYKIVEEYGKLIRIRFPSDIENDRILEIMELAVYDTELNELINQEDKKYLEENNLDEYSNVELDNLTNLSLIENNNQGAKVESNDSSNLVLFPRLNTLCSSHSGNRKSSSFNIRDAIPCVVAAGIFTCVGIVQFCNTLNQEKQISFKYASTTPREFYQDFSVKYAGNYFLSNANNAETQMSVCSSNGSINNQEIENYYISFTQLKNQIVREKLQPSQVKGEVRELQVRAERQQREAEKNQRYLENQKELAEVQHNYDEAQSLKDQAKTALSQSQQWLCLSKQALNLSIR